MHTNSYSVYVEPKQKTKCCTRLSVFISAFFLFGVFYTFFGYLCKWLYFHNEPNKVNLTIFNLQQFMGFVLITFLCLWFWWFSFKCCPMCTKYSSYEKNKEKQFQYWSHIMGCFCITMISIGLIELFSYVYENNL